MREYSTIIFLIIALIAYSIGVCALGVWLLSLAFGFTFTWFKAFAVWVCISLFTGGIKFTISTRH